MTSGAAFFVFCDVSVLFELVNPLWLGEALGDEGAHIGLLRSNEAPVPTYSVQLSVAVGNPLIGGGWAGTFELTFSCRLFLDASICEVGSENFLRCL